jgi:hypothetical protein
MGKRFGLLYNGVKVAFTEAQKAQVENKRSWTPFFGFGKVEIIRG